MNAQRMVVLGGGTVAMLILMLLRRKSFPNIQIWKFPVLSILLTCAGVAGTMLMYYIETGHFGGTSFFGAILFVPVLMLPACLLRVPYGRIMDLCAPAECLMLAFMKVDCMLSGCCIGKYLPTLGFQFPSQVIEMLVALVIMSLLIWIERRPLQRNTLYGHYLIFYGATRFVLNWFRYGVKPFVWVLPAGNFWSLVAIAFGAVWLAATAKRSRRKER